MDNVVYFPVIDADEFEPFLSIMHGELPRTHGEWLQRHTDRTTYWRGEGKTIIEVQVKADQFASFINSRGHGANMNSLFVFAEFIGKRHGD
jgi:hypothetical protein